MSETDPPQSDAPTAVRFHDLAADDRVAGTTAPGGTVRREPRAEDPDAPDTRNGRGLPIRMATGEARLTAFRGAVDAAMPRLVRDRAGRGGA